MDIKELNEQIVSLEEKLKDKERRNFLRLPIGNEVCKFYILKIGDKDIDLVKNRMGEGIISDISFTGLHLESIYNLPVKDAVEIKMEFEFDNHEFEIRGLLMRKEEHINSNKLIYGVKFIEAETRAQNDLNKLIRNKELEKRRKMLEQKEV